MSWIEIKSESFSFSLLVLDFVGGDVWEPVEKT